MKQTPRDEDSQKSPQSTRKSRQRYPGVADGGKPGLKTVGNRHADPADPLNITTNSTGSLGTGRVTGTKTKDFISNFGHGNTDHTTNYAAEGHGGGAHSGNIGSYDQITGTHGDGAHVNNYVLNSAFQNHGDGVHASLNYADKPHGNAQHTTNYAADNHSHSNVATHDNAAHNPNFSAVNHNHSQDIKVMSLARRKAACELRERLRARMGESDEVDGLLVLMALVLDNFTETLDESLGRTTAEQWEHVYRPQMDGTAHSPQSAQEHLEMRMRPHPDLDAILTGGNYVDPASEE